MSILFVEEKAAKQITIVFQVLYAHSFFLVFYYFTCEWINIKQSEMKNNTEEQQNSV